MYAYLCVTCHLHFWQNDQSFTCHCSKMGWNGHWIKESAHKLTLEKKIVLLLLLEFELATFQSQVRHSYQQAIPAPTFIYMPTNIHAHGVVLKMQLITRVYWEPRDITQRLLLQGLECHLCNVCLSGSLNVILFSSLQMKSDLYCER